MATVPVLSSKQHQQLPLLRGVSLAVLVCAYLLAHFPILPELPLCIFKRLTHFPCPTCGLTRAFLAISQGEFQLAFQYHPLSMALYLWLCTLVVFPVLGIQLVYSVFSKKGLCGLAFTLLVAWIFKLTESPSYW